MTQQEKLLKAAKQFAMAKKFARLLRREIGPKNLAEVRKRNADNARKDSDACASHDFCDANMVMLATYASVSDMYEDDVDVGDQEVLDEFNAAWDCAKATYLTEGKP